MDIHPLIVHFAFAFLVMYALLEMYRFLVREERESWANIRQFLLVTGLLAGFFALASGGIAEGIRKEAQPDLEEVIEMHALLVSCAYWIFFALGLGHLTLWLEARGKISEKNMFAAFGRMLRLPVVVALGSLIGLILFGLGGSLGAALTHGKDADFVVSIVYNIFFPSAQ